MKDQTYLPDDVIYSIFTFISPETLKSYVSISSQFYKIITERLEWKFDFSGNLYKDENNFLCYDDGDGGAYDLIGNRMDEWLIFKKVKMLNLSFNCIDYCHFETLTSRLQSLRHLCLNYVVLDWQNLNCLLSDEKLTLTFESLELMNCSLNDDMMELLTSCKNLQNLTKLDVRSNRITTKTLDNIFYHSAFNNLRDFSASLGNGSSVTEISQTSTLICKLERLLFEDTEYKRIEDYCNACVENNTITSLSLIQCSLKKYDIIPLLNKLSNLKYLNLSKNRLGQDFLVLNDCFTLRNLEELILESNFIAHETCQLLIDKFENLKLFSLLGNNWFHSLNSSVKALNTSKEKGMELLFSYYPNGLDCLDDLEKIQAYCPKFGIHSIHSFSHNFFRTTKSLQIFTLIDNELFEKIGTSKVLGNLEEIEVNDCSVITLEMMSSLFKSESLKKLRKLKMFSCSLTGFPSIFNSTILRNMSQLILCDNNIGNEGLYNICTNCCNLRSLDVENNGIGIDGVKYLTSCKTMSKLAYLNLGNSQEIQNFKNIIDDDCIQLLCSSIYLNNLVSLFCCGNTITAISAQYIVSKSGLPNLSILVLYDNNICDRGAEVFSENVESLRHYNIFDVSNNDMTDYGVNLMSNISQMTNRSEYLFYNSF
ncbi:hypothetical protein NAEGRDRAFT_72272 [Naegleria gruberi]|uniref:F-box domain-containing protein n=1 Tax=Naegleria gruberi TaxID=5762 RepID=D2VTE6_NAEGR|nr:uncharacterized protein NAEGRDRAFT_72272 [Naegleria gruberi]EFC39917.1 hypothetical protein NAEGRDRAFT_72272 [Naegleria gruberi]|eukprot:XP_002672661.1 hypothetical protein NAEGRDRAFT_72272 [Naegleria gruberi strain NEG-M]